MIMKQGNTGGRVVTFRKILVNPSSGASFVPVANSTPVAVAAGSVQSNVVTNGVMVSSVAANGVLTSSSNGLVLTQHTNGVANSSAGVHVVSASGGTPMISNGVVSNGASVSTNVNSTFTNGVIHSGITLLNGSAGNAARPQNGRVIGTAATGPVQQTTINSVPGRIPLSSEQLQRLLEQQLNQQPNTGQPQIIRLQNPHQLIRLQQPPAPQFVRVQQQPQQPQQIIHMPPNQFSVAQGQQLVGGRIFVPPGIHLTQQQLQQIQQQMQQRPQQPITIQSIQLQQPIQQQQQQQQQTLSNLLPGVQVVSIANAQTSLLQQQKQQFQQQTVSNTVHQPMVTSHQQQVVSSQPLQIVSHQQFVSTSQQQQQPIVSSQSQRILVNNNFTNTVTSQPQQQQLLLPKIENPQLHSHQQQNGQPNQSHSGQVGNSLLLNTSQQLSQSMQVKTENLNDCTAVEPKQESSQACHSTVDDDDDDDIKEIGQVVHTKPPVSKRADAIADGVDPKTEGGGGEEGGGSEPDPGVIDIVINNVVCSFSVGCHIDLREIAMTGNNVEYRRENGMVTMKLRRPLTTASIWSSGKITCTGSTSEPQAHLAARRVARILQKLGCNTRFRNFRVVNVLGTCSMPFAIKVTPFSKKHKKSACYEPELHPGVTYRIHHPKATLKIFSTGSITVTAPSVANVQAAIEHVYPLVSEFSKERTAEEEARRNESKMQHSYRNIGVDEEEDDIDPLTYDQIDFGLPQRHRRKRRRSGDHEQRFLNQPVNPVYDYDDDSSDSSDLEDVDNFS